MSKLSSRSLLIILGLMLGLLVFVYACFNAGMSWLNKDSCAQVEMAAIAYLGHEPKESVRDLILGACKAAGDYFKVASQLEDCVSFSVVQAVAEAEEVEAAAKKEADKKDVDKKEADQGKQAADKSLEVKHSGGEKNGERGAAQPGEKGGETKVAGNLKQVSADKAGTSEAPSALAMMKGLAQSYPENPEILAITGCLLRNQEDVDHQTEALIYLKKAQILGLSSENLYADIANALSYLSDIKLMETAEGKKALVTLQTKYGITKDNYNSLRWEALENGLRQYPHSSLLLFLRSDFALHEVWSCKASEIDKYWNVCKKDATELVLEQSKLRPKQQGEHEGTAGEAEADGEVEADAAVDGDATTSAESAEGYLPNYYVRGLLMRGYATAMLGDVKAGEKDVLKAVADMLKIADEEESDSGKKEAHLWLARYYWDVGELQKAKEEYLKVKALPEEPAEEGTFIYSSSPESLATEWQTFSKAIK